jgi:uncharacterized membrane protein HdeD (DUF308 family)
VGFVLNLFPTMEWFWVVAAGLMLLPIALVLIFNPAETRVRELEEIETER